MTLGARIKKARKIAGISRTELAKLSKVPYSTISEIENNEQKTSTKIVELSVALGVNPMWLSTGVGTIGRYDDVAHEIIAKIKTDEDPPEDDDVVVEVVDIELAAGSGSNTVEFVETKDHHTYKLGFLKKLGIKDHSKVKRCKVRGNSMEPTLFNGDTVSINTEDTALIDDAVYAIVVSDQLRVKRLRRTRDGGILIKSDNSTQWPDEFIPPNEADTVKILGRVFDKSGRGGLGF